MAKAVFFDIDFTMVEMVTGHVPASAARAIRALRENGHYAFLNSGRSRGHIRESALYEAGFDGLVSGLGTMVECASGKASDARGTITPELREEDILYEYRMPIPMVTEAIDRARRFGFRPMLEGREYVYFEASDFKNDIYAKIVSDRIGDRVQSIEEHRGKWQISKLSCDMAGADIEGGLAAFAEDYDIVLHSGIVCELTPKGHGKETGMEKICAHLGIPMADAVAFGDSNNDYKMMAAAGTSVAMGNAVDEIKAMADLVTTNIDDDGVWNGLCELGLIS